MLQFMYITNDPDLARIIYDEGVKRIFIDWEVNGKQERQGHLNAVMSQHSYEDALAVRKAVPEAELMIRLNPFYDGTEMEVEKAILAGADLLMLPMFYTLEEVRSLCDMANGRVGIIPLFETPESLNLVRDIVHFQGVYEIYIGLNDLHLALGLDFMFEPLASGMLEDVAQCTKQAGLRFGFGGIARADEGAVSGAMVLGEHLRLRSDAVILSRTFYRPDEEKDDAHHVFFNGLASLRAEENKLMQRNEYEIAQDHKVFCSAVHAVVQKKRDAVT